MMRRREENRIPRMTEALKVQMHRETISENLIVGIALCRTVYAYCMKKVCVVVVIESESLGTVTKRG